MPKGHETYIVEGLVHGSSNFGGVKVEMDVKKWTRLDVR